MKRTREEIEKLSQELEAKYEKKLEELNNMFNQIHQDEKGEVGIFLLIEMPNKEYKIAGNSCIMCTAELLLAHCMKYKIQHNDQHKEPAILAIGVIPQNDPDAIAEMLDSLGEEDDEPEKTH